MKIIKEGSCKIKRKQLYSSVLSWMGQFTCIFSYIYTARPEWSREKVTAPSFASEWCLLVLGTISEGKIT